MAYTLKDFDYNLAATGFECIMLTGSFASGDSIDDETLELFPKGTVAVNSSKVSILNVEEGKPPVAAGEYMFNDVGRCQTEGYGAYKLMILGAERTAPDEGTLEAINETLGLINDTLNEIKEVIASYIQQTEDRLEALENQ